MFNMYYICLTVFENIFRGVQSLGKNSTFFFPKSNIFFIFNKERDPKAPDMLKKRSYTKAAWTKMCLTMKSVFQ